MAWPAVQLPGDVLSEIFHILRDQKFAVNKPRLDIDEEDQDTNGEDQDIDEEDRDIDEGGRGIGRGDRDINEEDRDSQWFYREHGFPAHWIRTTWVCRSWRDAALHTRRLWTDFSTPLRVKHPEAIATFLGRAPPGMPLRVYVGSALYNWINTADEESTNALEHLRPWASRIEFLWLSINNKKQLKKANSFLGTLGSALQTLAFRVEARSRPSPLNIHGLQNLRTLCFQEWVPSANVPLPNITSVNFISTFTARPLAIHRFLTKCPGLEHLYIAGGLATRLSLYDPSDFPVVDLPQLETLTIRHDPPDAVAAALTAFRLPATATFKLETSSVNGYFSRHLLRTHDWARHKLPSHLDDLDVLSCTDTLTVQVDGTPGSDHGYTRLEGGVHGWDPERFWSFKVASPGFNLMRRQRYFVRFTDGIPLIVQMTHLTRLELHFADWLPLRRASLWQEILSELHVLHSLTIGGWEAIEAATRTLEDDLALLPALRVLRLCINSPPRYREDLVGEAMLRWLVARQEEGAGLERFEAGRGRHMPPQAIKLVTRILTEAQTKSSSLATELFESRCESCGWRRPLPQGVTSGRVTEKKKSSNWGWETESSDEESESELESFNDEMATSGSESSIEVDEGGEEYGDGEALEDTEEGEDFEGMEEGEEDDENN